MLTILTPTYNRRHTLPRLYESLSRQRRKDFEWVIVDDGSDDDTMAWAQACQAQAGFPVRALRQDNGGKHAAVNLGVRASRMDWILIVDSDDLLTDDALDQVADALDAAASAPRFVAGVCFRKADLQGRLLGTECRGQSAPFTGVPTAVGRMVRGDLAYVFRRGIMESLPFPIIPGEKFVPELYIWNQIGDQGEIWFYLDRTIYLCEYLDDGYTRTFHEQLRRNPSGFLLFYTAQIGREPHWRDKAKAVIRSFQCLAYCVAKASSDRRRPRT